MIPQTRPVEIHGLADALIAAEAAAALGVPLMLLSAPGAGAYAGAGWWLGLVEAVRQAQPGLAVEAVLDCADRPGAVLAALRAGVRSVVFTGAAEAAAALADIAGQTGATLLTGRPEALGLRGRRDAAAACRAWLGAPS